MPGFVTQAGRKWDAANGQWVNAEGVDRKSLANAHFAIQHFGALLGLDAETRLNTKKDIGKRISVYSSRYDEWAPGCIIAVDAERRMHCVQYDGSERRWHRMDMLKFQILHSGEEGHSPPGARGR